MSYTMGAVAAAGTSPPTLTLTGTPNQYVKLRVECTTAGARGTWVLRYSTNGGTSWTSAVLSAATVTILTAAGGATGLTLNIAVGAASTDNVWTALSSSVAKLHPKADIFDPIATYLLTTTGVPSFFGIKHLAGQGRPPRFVWVPTTGNTDGPGAIGSEPRSLADVAMTFEVHCWGADFDIAWALMATLVSTVRELVTANYELGQVDALPTEDNINGWVITVPVVITLPLYEDPTDHASYVLGQATTAVIDDSQGIDPDGTLTAPQK